MLWRADAALAARDPVVPGLGLVLDPDALAAALRQVLPAAGIDRAAATYVRYKPATSCIVGYRFATAGGTVDAYAKAHSSGDEDKAAKVLEREAAPGPWGPGAVALGDEVVVSFLPNDSGLRALRRLHGHRLGRTLEGLLPGRPDLWDGRLSLLRYKPERRWVARVDTTRGPSAVLRCYAGEEFEAASVASGAFRSAGGIRTPERLGISSRKRLIVTEWLQGSLLVDVLQSPSAALPAVEGVGAALAELHAQGPGALRHRSRTEEADALTAAATSAGALLPEIADGARDLADGLGRALRTLPDAAAATHGDFSADQVLVCGNAVAILDLDAAAIGDPASDLALFQANLLTDPNLDIAHAEAVTAALLRGYSKTAQDSADLAARVDLYTAVWLVRLAAEPFRYRKADWPRRIRDVLAQAAARWRP